MLLLLVRVMSQVGRPSALIVGAGPGGLASALLLQHSGVDVTVVELSLIHI